MAGPIAAAAGVALLVGACALAVMLVRAESAAGQSGGGGDGGAMFVAKPKIAKVSCVRKCASRKRPQGGSTLRITGSSLGGAATVLFQGSYGTGDDRPVTVRPGTDTRLKVRVPVGAITGPISVQTVSAVSSPPSATVPILPPPPPEPNPVLSPVPGPPVAGAPVIETGTSRTRAFIGARRAVTFSYRLSETAAVTVELVNALDGAVVKTWVPTTAAVPGQVQSVSWDGRLDAAAAAAPGRYSFRLTAAAASGVTARSAQGTAVERDAFDLYDHVFPVRGKHDFGGAGAVFGTGRAGHSHQGQDVFAKCGTRMVAARGGRVKHAAYHAAAGNYVVVGGDASGLDYVYMHLAEPTPFRAGDRVYTGQRIGSVGDTGNARGCHLHFELWDSPGWYDGGSPFDPLPSLLAWDGWS